MKSAGSTEEYADKKTHYNEGASTNGSYGYEEEFNHTPWLFCMLNNFGGRLGMHGHLDNLAKGIPYEQAKSMAEGTDDFTRKLLEINAKALITTWGSCQQSEIGKQDNSGFGRQMKPGKSTPGFIGSSWGNPHIFNQSFRYKSYILTDQ